MTTPFRPYVPRMQRIMNILRTKPRELFYKEPEMVVFCSTFGVAGMIAAIYKMYIYGPSQGVKPWYRSYYHVVRPDARVALEWRLPEEYPARYETNREGNDGLTAASDYGWNYKIRD